MLNSCYTNILDIYDFVWLGFYGISTIVDYLMPNIVYIYLDLYNLSKYCLVSLKIQLNISHLFTYCQMIKQFYFLQFNFA